MQNSSKNRKIKNKIIQQFEINSNFDIRISRNDFFALLPKIGFYFQL